MPKMLQTKLIESKSRFRMAFSDLTAALTVVITSKNRCDELRRALQSTQQPDVQVAVVVIDDGSEDGTSAMVAQEFPVVKLHRFEESQGLIARRNQLAQLAQTPLIISIDDDAVFTSPDIFTLRLRAFQNPRVGALALPFVDVCYGPDVHQAAPDDEEIYVTDAIRGTAHALRREVFLELGGYRSELVHQGEERDFCLRLLEAGYVTRLGFAPPIHHHESPRRDTSRMDFYGRRNDILCVWNNVPGRYLMPHLLATWLKGLLFGVRVSRPTIMLRGLFNGLQTAVKQKRGRQPVSVATYRLHRKLKQERIVPLIQIEQLLSPITARNSSGETDS